MPVGDPVDQVEPDEDGRGEPHRPVVDVVTEGLLVRRQRHVLIKQHRLFRI